MRDDIREALDRFEVALQSPEDVGNVDSTRRELYMLLNSVAPPQGLADLRGSLRRRFNNDRCPDAWVDAIEHRRPKFLSNIRSMKLRDLGLYVQLTDELCRLFDMERPEDDVAIWAREGLGWMLMCSSGTVCTFTEQDPPPNGAIHVPGVDSYDWQTAIDAVLVYARSR